MWHVRVLPPQVCPLELQLRLCSQLCLARTSPSLGQEQLSQSGLREFQAGPHCCALHTSQLPTEAESRSPGADWWPRITPLAPMSNVYLA